jgi:hypothetical protein
MGGEREKVIGSSWNVEAYGHRNVETHGRASVPFLECLGRIACPDPSGSRASVQ